MSSLEASLNARFGARLRRDLPLGDLTSFRIGGPGDFVLEVEDEEELAAAITNARRCEMPVTILGSGTNVLVSDRGIRGLVVRQGRGLRRIDFDGTAVAAGAAARFARLVAETVRRGLAGLEFGEGIPGSVGGALIMNAGAFGGEMASVVIKVHGVTADGRLLGLARSELGLGYRRSALPGGFIVTSVDFELAHAERKELERKVAELRARRAAHQPHGRPNAGSIFKNPQGAFAGRLLEQCGLKGERIGNAAFSHEHANFIVNLGGAQAADVCALIERARDRVLQQTGVLLETEVKLIGEW